MKYSNYRKICCLSLLILTCVAAPVGTFAAACAVSDESALSTDDGCMLAFVYNQKDDYRLIVLDEKNRHRYEAPLKESKKAPFWEGGKVYVVNISGGVQGFRIASDKLVAEKEEKISPGLVRVAAYHRGQHRLYLIQSAYDDQRRIHHNLVCIDFPARKTIWTKRIDEAGLLKVFDPSVCVISAKLVQVFDCNTGEKIAGSEVTKAAATTDANVRK